MYNYGSFTARSKYNQLNHFSIMDLIKRTQPSEASSTADVTSPETLNMIKCFKYVDDETRALISKRQSPISRLFPTAKQKMINEIKNNALQLNGEMYLNSVKALGQFQIEALKEELNDRLMRGAAIIRTETIKVAQAKLMEVSDELLRNQQALVKQLERELDFCQTIKSDVLRSKYIDAIVRHTDDMFDTFDRLSQHFKNFLDLKIGTGYSMDMKAQ